MENLPPDHFVRTGAFTRHSHRDIYPAIDPAKTPALSQAGRVVVIVGASAGIGARGLVPVFAAAKPKALVLVSRNAEGLAAAKASAEKVCGTGEGATAVELLTGDVSDLDSVAAVWAKIKERHGHADVLVSSAGAMAGMAPVGQVDPAKWWADFDVNVRGFYANVHHFLDLLGAERKGYIVNIGGSMSTYVQPGTSSYGIGKLAAWKVCEFVTKETAGRIQAVSIHPGLVHTQLTMDIFRKFALDTPELVGGTAVWCATDEAAFLSGRLINANWDIEELKKMKDDIEKSGDLFMVWQGKFGVDTEID